VGERERERERQSVRERELGGGKTRTDIMIKTPSPPRARVPAVVVGRRRRVRRPLARSLARSFPRPSGPRTHGSLLCKIVMAPVRACAVVRAERRSALWSAPGRRVSRPSRAPPSESVGSTRRRASECVSERENNNTEIASLPKTASYARTPARRDVGS